MSKKKQRPVLETLEPRVLYSADPFGVVFDLPAIDPTEGNTPSLLDSFERQPTPLIDSPSPTDEHNADTSDLSTTPATPFSGARLELVFVDTSTPDYQQLLDDLLSQSEEARSFEVIVIDAQANGINTISESLTGYRDIDAVHIISHGSNGALKLGSATLDAQTLQSQADEISQWANVFSESGDILFYGCDLASDESGKALIESIAALTKTDVAASDDLTGHASLGGDWNLEYRSGIVDSTVAVSSDFQYLWSDTLATFTVANTNDSGAGSLRQAIINANANSGADTIEFGIAGGGTQVINLTTALNVITEQVSIDGTTQTGWSEGSFLPVVLDGNGGGFDALTFSSSSDGSEIRGLVVRDFDSDTIDILAGADNITIAGNFIGQFNSDGTDAGDGEANTFSGVRVYSDNVTIGGSSAADRNLISGNEFGVLLRGTAANTIIAGNYFGTDVTGSVTIGSDNAYGVYFNDSTNSSTVGGTTSAEGNVFAGININSVALFNEYNDNITIQSNSMGVSADGLTLLDHNDGTGSALYIANGGDNTQILENMIAGARYAGIELDTAGTSNATVIQGNTIGTDATGTKNWGHGENGILVENANNTIIGGVGGGEGNVIAFSGQISAEYGSAISIQDGGSGNAIRGNSIYSNANIGIDLSAGTVVDGLTPNDAGDVDSGSNNLQNWAVLTSASINDAGTLAYTIDTSSFASGSYSVDFYASTDRQGGEVEGKRYLGTITGVADGNSALAGTLASVTLALEEYVTVVATDSGGNSSEFSNYAVAFDGDAGGTSPSDLLTSQSSSASLSLNRDGGNDAYLVADTSPFGGQSAITVEVQFSIDSPATGLTPLISYADGSNEDELFIGIDSGGQIFFRTSANGSVGYGSVASAPQLLDGERHSVAVTWENTGGILMFYVDGEQLGVGRNDYQKTTTIDTGGTLVFGQHQTSPGVFDNNDVFSGTLYDVRIFDDVRTAEEIQSSYASNLPWDEDALMANWSFDDLSNDGVITDSVIGNKLAINHIMQSGFTASVAELTFSVDENAINGAVVGAVSGTDAEREAQIATLLSGNPNLHYSAETGKFYEYIDTGKNWSTALADAQTTSLSGVSGNLVTVNSAVENQIVVDLMNANGATQAYIAASDSGIEGEWRWYGGGAAEEKFYQGDGDGYNVDGAYTNWDGTNPNNSSGQHYAKIFASTGLWDDVDGTATQKSIIEYDADAVLDTTHALTYSITAQPESGAFAIDASTGKITVADGSKLDYDTRTSHTISLEVADGDGNTLEEDFIVSLNDLAESNHTPSDLSNGIELNTDGGNDAYLKADDGGALLGGLTAFTLETSFSLEDNDNEPSLLSYYVSSDEIRLRFDTTDHLRFKINNVNVTTSNTYSELLDGNLHHVAVSWDNTNGDVSFYIDGEFAEHITGLSAGHTIAAGGTLVLGNDQDGLDTGYKTSQTFSGTLYDTRIWNEARSAEEIAFNYQHKFDTGALPSNLVANWLMDGFNGSNEIVDAVSGNNLSIGHATGTGFIASIPVGDLHIHENSLNGSTVGFVVPSIPNAHNDIVNDGLFLEAGIPTTHQTYTSPTSLGDWQVVENDVQLLGDSYERTPLNGQSVDLNGSAPAAIEQALVTEAGRQYQVTFALSGEWSGGEPTKDVRFSADGQSADFSIEKPDNWSRTNMLWEYRSFTFTASDTSTALRISSLDGPNIWGPVIGEVQVTEIPATVTSILNNDPTLTYDAGTGKFYKHVHSFVDWTSAQSAATSSTLNGVNGQLATIHSAYENELLRNLSTSSWGTWIGATDTAVEGDFRWSDGTQADELFWTGGQAGSAQTGSYTNFETLQPDNLGNADAVYLKQASGLWDDQAIAPASVNTYFIEWDANEVLSNFTFSLSDDAGGRFSIDNTSGEISVADGSLLDYETAPSHNVSVEVTDAAGNTYSETMAIAVDNRGGEPTQSLPTSLITLEDTPRDFSVANGNAITVSDTNAGTDMRLQVYISTNFNGTLTLSQTTGLSILGGSNGGTFMSIQGTESNLNAAFDGMTFTPASGYNGPVTLNMTTSLGADLEGRYEFEGNANDTGVGLTQDGTLVGNAATVTDPERAEVLSLDGNGDYVAITSEFGQPTDLTLAAWINFSSTASNAGEVISLSNGVALRVGDASEGVTGFFYDGATFEYISTGTSSTLKDDVWHHVAFSFDDANNTQNLYIDGVLVASANHTVSITYPTWYPGTTIGSHADPADSSFDFNGLIDDARLYDRALSADEIASLASNNESTASSVAITVNPVSTILATNDPVSTNEDTAVIITPTANDTGSVSVIEFTQPTHGTVLDNGNGTFTYTPDSNYTGADSFGYVITDTTANLSHYWNLDGTATDSVGSNNGTLTGTTTVAGDVGNGLLFNESSDYVEIPDVSYNNEFSISLDIKIDDNTGTLFQYFYSHGDVNSTNSINVFLNEDTHGTDPNKLRTVVRDTNDTLDNTALEFDASAIIGDGLWHTYTLTVGADGAKVYLDGVLQNSDSRGTDAIDPASNLFLGVRSDLDANRMFGGSLDSLQIFDSALNSSQVANMTDGSTRATVNITVDAINEAPTFTNLDGNPTYIEGAAAVVLDADASILDQELSAVDNFSGATLTLERDTGADNNDVFSPTGSITALNEGFNLQVDGTVIGTITSNSNGSLGILFNGNATNTLVNSFMQQIAYSNSDANPVGSVQINWTFDDGNTGSQGTGGALDVTGNTIVNITAVNDAPEGADKTITLSEDTPYTLAVADFGFSDDNGDVFERVYIMSIPSNGQLLYNGSAFAAGNWISADDITSGLLTFEPANNANGAGYTSFDFQVQDDGGTASGGQNRDTTSNTITFNVNAVNDAPIAATDSYTVNEGSTTNLDLASNDTDVDDGLDLASITIASAPANGSIVVNANGTVDYTHNGSDTVSDSFTYTINDATGASSNTVTVSVTVTPQNDTPTLGNNSLTLLEGETVTINSAFLTGTDSDNLDSGLTFNVSNVSGGHFAWAASPQSLISSFTQAQVTANQVAFVHDGGEAAPDYDVAVSDGSTSTAAASAAISFTNVNDAPLLAALGGDTQTVPNDGTVTLVDTGALATLIDADLPVNYSGATLVVTGNSFDGLDLLGASTAGSISLSSGISDGSALSVGGTSVATLSATSSAGLTLTFNANATLSDVEAILRALTFESTSLTLGSRSIDIVFNDGDGTANGGNDTSPTTTVHIALSSVDDGLVATNEDTTHTFSVGDFDFTGVTGGHLDKITVTALPSDGALTLNGSLVTLNQEITKVQIDAGLLRFAPAADANGSLYASFGFFVNSGKDSVTILAGEPSSFTLNGGSLTTTDAIIADSNHFGPGGTVSTNISVTSTSTSIDAAYLSQGSVFFNGYVPNVDWTASELTSLDNWVQAGGILISNSDTAGYDQVSTHYGLTIGGTASPTWHVNDPTHAIMNGPFGSVGGSGNPFSAAGTISYFDSASLTLGDQVIAVDSVSGEPTLVMRQVGSGFVLFTGDEGIFRAGMTGGGTISTANDILAANIFAWAADQVTGVTTHLMNIDVTAVNDDPTNGGSLPSDLNVTEDVSSNIDLSSINLSDVDHSGGNLTLTLTTSTGGNLSATTGGGVTIAGSASGVLTLTGTQANLNTYLDTTSNVQYLHGTANTVGNDADTINVVVNDNGNTGTGGGTDQNLGTVNVDITAVNDVPVATGNTVVTSEDVPLVIASSEFNFSDVENDALASVTITGLNLNGGTLTHSAGAVVVTHGMTVTAAELADLTFTSALNNNTNSSFTYTVNDAGLGVTSALMNITVNAVNDVPVATGNTVVATEDVPLVIGAGDFSFSDVEGDALTSVTITGLTLNGGTLTHSAGAVTVSNGMTVTAAELADLTFTSALNDSTNSSFSYAVNDAGTGVTSATLNITVNAVNDVPVATGNTVIATEDVPLVIGVGDFSFSDVESDALASVTITGLSLNGGTLTHSAGAVTVTNGMTVTAAQLADLTFTSALNDSTNSSFSYTVNDVGTGVTSAAMNITVNAVNDVPVATGNTVIATEDVPLVIGAGDFSFSDAEGDSLASVTISSLTLNGGSLTHSAGAVTVSNGMTVTAAQLADLTFTSALNDSTNSSFSYTVNDAGLGVTSATMNITVNAVNDVPVATGNTVIATEDLPLVIGAGDFSFSDAEGDSLVSVTITGLTLNGGTLTHSAGAITVSNGMTVTAAELADLTFTSALNDNTNSSFTYTVNDAGTGVASAVMNITVNAVNDAPTFDAVLPSFTKSTVGTGLGAMSVSSADFDADGDIDVAAAFYGAGTVAWYENDGNENFSYHLISNAPTNPHDVSVADVDGDGDIDVLSAAYNSDEIAWYENNGSGSFTRHVITNTANAAWSVTTADVDGDGDIDVLSASYFDNTVAWYENDGSENFTKRVVSSTDSGVRDVTTGDVDGDGDIDVLSSGNKWYENDGSENFTEHTISAGGFWAGAISVYDVDNDGDIDVLTAEAASDTIAWHENDGSGNFTSHDITTSADAAEDVTAADVDGDGDIDVLSASGNDNTIAWYENDGSENFTARVIDNAASGARKVVTADVDGDGGLDVLSASATNNTIAWYDNEPTSTLDGNPTFIEDGSAVVLDADVDIRDSELDTLHGGNGNYAGASLTLLRNSGANSDDVLSFNDGNGITLSGSNLIKNSQFIASFDTTSTAGELVITLTDANTEIPTSADVDNILRQITYANSSDTPPASVSLDWTFDDGNTSAQGSGGSLSAVGSTNVNITAVNDVPIATGNTVVATEDLPLVIAASDFNFSDAEGDGLTSVTITGLTLNGGTLTHSAGAVTVTNGMTVTAAELADLTFTSASNDSTNSSFAYTVNDAGTGITSAVMNITVNAVNDVPVATGNTVVALEDIPLVIGAGDFSFTDAEGDSLTSVNITGLTLNGGTLTHSAGAVTVTNGMTVTAAELADLTFTSASNDSTNSSFTYTVNDAGTGVTSAVMNITVNAVNDVPVATGNTVIASEDIPLVIAAGDFSFTDVEGDSLTSVNITGLTLNGGTLTHSAGAVTVTNGMTVTVAELADLTFTSASNDSTNSSFTYTVNDAGTGVTSAVMSITVNAANDVPVATGNTVVATEDLPLVIAAGDFSFTDVESDSLTSVTITGLTLNSGTLTHSAGAVTVTNGMTVTAAELADLTFTSALNDSTNSSLTYTVNDAGTGVTSAVMNITVNAVNDVPVATGNTVVATEDVPLVIGAGDFSFSDVEGDSLASVTITGLSLNGGSLTHSAGAVTVSNGMTVTAAQLADLTFTSALNDSTNSSFSYTVNDAGLGVTSATMNITVNAVNDVPVATGNTVVATEDMPLVIGPSDFNFSDVEGDALASITVTGLTLNGGTLTHSAGAVTVTNGMTVTAAELADLTFTSALNDNTNSSFTYTVNDAGTGVASAVMNITVNAVNDVPVATGNTVVAMEDVPLVIGTADFSFSDVEGDSLTSVTVSGLNLNGGSLTHSAGAVTVSNGMTITAAELADLTFTSALNDSTNSSFTYTVNDAGLGVTSATMNITVNAVNDVPVATGNTVVASEDVPLVISAGDFSYTDEEGDSLISVTVTGLSLNGGTLTHSAGAVTVTNGMTITAAQLADLTFTSAANDSSNASFTYTVNDADAGVTSAVMNITVDPVNDAPVALGNTVTATEDIPLVIDASDFIFTDVEGDALVSVTLTALNLNGGTLTHSAGTVTVTDGMTVTTAELADLTFVPALNANGSASFEYAVNDADSGLSTGTMNISIPPVNDVPVASGNTLSTTEDTPLLINAGEFLYTDIESDALSSVTVSNLQLNGGTLTHSAGTVTVTNGMQILAAQLVDLTFNPALNSSLPVSFDYRVNDADNGVIAATMHIIGIPINDAPVIVSNGGGDNAAVQTVENQAYVSTVVATDADVGDTLVYGIDGGSDAGLFSIDRDTGELRFANAPNFEAAQDTDQDNRYHIEVSASDGNGGIDQQALVITVVNQNESPEDLNLSNDKIDEDTDTANGFTIGLLSAHDEDLGDTLSFALVGGADVALFSLAGDDSDILMIDDGVINYQHQSAYELMVRATDTDGASVDRVFNITVTPNETITLPVTEGPLVVTPVVEPAEEITESILIYEEVEQLETDTPKEKSSNQPSSVDIRLESMAIDELVRVASELNTQGNQESEFSTDEDPMIPLKHLDLANLNLMPLGTLSIPATGALSVFENESFTEALQRMSRDMENAFEEDEKQHRLIAEISSGVTLSLTAGFISWMLQSGSLLASLLSAAPVWKKIDPLLILAASKRKAADLPEETEEEKRVAEMFD